MFTQRRTPATRPPRQALHRDRVILAILFGGGLLRLWLIHVLALEAFEFEDLHNWSLGRLVQDLANANNPSGSIDWNQYHAPLAGIIGGLSRWLLMALGLSDNISTLRALNLPFMVVNIILIIRMGEHLGAPIAGRVTAALLAFSPGLVIVGSRFGPYAFEMTFALAFLERLLSSFLDPDEGPNHAQIGAFAALAIWTSYLSLLLVGPGLLMMVIRAAPGRSRYRSLGLIAALLLLVAPVLQSAIFASMDLGAAIHPSGFGADIRTTIGDSAHPVFTTESAMLRAVSLPLRLPTSLVGIPGALVIAFGWLLLWRTRHRGLLLAAACIVALFAVADAVLFTRWINHLSIIPAMLLLGLAGWECSKNLRIRPARWAAIALVLCTIVPTSTLLWQATHARPEELRSWASGRTTWFSIVEEVHHPYLFEHPLRVNDPERLLNLHHLTCGGPVSITNLVTCPAPRAMEEASLLEVERRSSGLLLIEARLDTAELAHPPAGCVLRIGTPRIHLYDCPPIRSEILQHR